MLNRLTLLKHAPVSSPLAKPRPLPHRAARGSPLRHAVDAVATGIRWWWSRRMARCSCDAAGSLVTLSLWVTPKKISHIWAIYWFKLTHILDIYNILKIILDGGDDITLGWHLFFRLSPPLSWQLAHASLQITGFQLPLCRLHSSSCRSQRHPAAKGIAQHKHTVATQ